MQAQRGRCPPFLLPVVLHFQRGFAWECPEQLQHLLFPGQQPFLLCLCESLEIAEGRCWGSTPLPQPSGRPALCRAVMAKTSFSGSPVREQEPAATAKGWRGLPRGMYVYIYFKDLFYLFQRQSLREIFLLAQSLNVFKSQGGARS